MKNLTKLIALLIIIFSSSIYTQNSGWLVQQSGVTSELLAIHMEDGQTGWVCGAGGVILKTTNGGNSWFAQPSGVSTALRAIFFTSLNTGWAAGDGGRIIRTTNGGASWSTLTTGVTSSFKCIWFGNSNTGYAAGQSGKIVKTTNSGAVWIAQNSNVTSDINSVMFTDNNTGWASGSAGKILKTTNAGVQWVVSIDHGPVSEFYGLCFPNQTCGTGLGRYVDQSGVPFVYFYETDNGGYWWLYQTAPTNITLRSLYFADSINGWAAGDSGKIYGTVDKGATWVEQNSRTTNGLNALYFTSYNIGFAVGKNGTIIRTNHGGFRDTVATNRRDLGVIPLVEDIHQLINAKYRVQFRPDTSYNILRSFNNGASFDTLISSLTFADTGRYFDGMLVKVKKIKFYSLNPSGNYVGNVGVIHDPNISSDSIQTRFKGWDYFPPQNNPYDSSRYAVTAIYRPYQSQSMSISYPTRNTYIGFRSMLTPEQLRKVKIVFTGYGSGQLAYRYLCSSPGIFGLQNMAEVPFKVYEIDETDGTSQPRQLNCGFLEFSGSAQNNKWEPTTDSTGGNEVLYIFNSNYSPVLDSFYNKNLFILQPTFDIMYVWAPRRISANANFHSGDEFYIYPYTVTRPEIAPGYPLYYEFSTQSVIGIEPISANIPDRFSLKQNYPNPFNPVTKIRFAIPVRQNVKIKIFDILGRQADEVLNSSLQGGEYEVKWDGSKMSSGIYFCRFESEYYSYTIKMILVK